MGLGARFTFTIPAVGEAANSAAPDSGRTVGSQARILAVDDEPQILRLVRNALSEAGYAAMVREHCGGVVR